MSRKKLLFPIFLVFVTALFSNVANAQEESGLAGVAETIQRLFGFIPNIITLEKLIGEEDAAIFWAKFLVWLLLFAGFFFGATKAFKDNKRIAAVVALVFSLIGTLMMPNGWIINIFQSYGFLSGLLIWVVPVAAGFYLVSKIKQRLMKALIYLLMIFVLLAIDKSITSTFAEGVADSIWFSLFRLVLAVVIIAFLWNLLFAGLDAVPHGGGEHGGEHRDGDHGREHDGNHRNHERDREHRRPEDRGPRPDEERRDEREMANEREIWNLLRRLRNNENLGRLITHPRDQEAIDRVRRNFGYIHQRTIYVRRDLAMEMRLENDDERRQRLRQLRFVERKINDELMRLIREERNLFTQYRQSIEALWGFIRAGSAGIDNNMPDDELKVIWQNASNAVLAAMRFIELLIRINAREIERIESFNE